MQLAVFWIHLLFLNPSGDLSEVCILAEWDQEILISASFLDWDVSNHAKCLDVGIRETEDNVKCAMSWDAQSRRGLSSVLHLKISFNVLWSRCFGSIDYERKLWSVHTNEVLFVSLVQTGRGKGYTSQLILVQSWDLEGSVAGSDDKYTLQSAILQKQYFQAFIQSSGNKQKSDLKESWIITGHPKFNILFQQRYSKRTNICTDLFFAPWAF